MIHDDDEISATEDEVQCLVQEVGDGQSLPLDRSVLGFGRVRETAADQPGFPARSAAERGDARAPAILLE